MAENIDPSEIVYNDKKIDRNGYASTPALDPRDGGEWDILISLEKLQKYFSKPRGRALELGYIVKDHLLRPTAIFRGVRQIDDGEDDWLCYICRPGTAYNYQTGIVCPAWNGQVMTVYITGDRVLYSWSWTDCDDQNLPIGHEDRYGSRLSIGV